MTTDLEWRSTRGGARLIDDTSAAKIADDLARFERWRNGRTSYDLSEIPDDVPQVTNEQRSALEVHQTLTDPPAHLFAYVQRINNAQRGDCGQTEAGCIIKTWTGDTLGRITYASPPYTDNFGGERQAIRVTLADDRGTLYWGTFYSSAGDYCRLTKAKNQSDPYVYPLAKNEIFMMPVGGSPSLAMQCGS